ncbi:MAG: N-acetylmuramoyl-L-alanine amidase [Acidobacteria bacterium]|nr:N-acetylmuramoyl-L-alanine amidase [Acidobacteriota bacterium]
MRILRGTVVVLLLVLSGAPAIAADPAEQKYVAALARERELRTSTPTLTELRDTMNAYQAIVRQHPQSGYCDNALWQASGLALEAYRRFAQDQDRQAGLRALNTILTRYPSSKLIEQVRDRTTQFQIAYAAIRPDRPVSSSSETTGRGTTPSPAAALGTSRHPTPDASGVDDVTRTVFIREITRTLMPEAVRIAIRMDREVPFRKDELENPRRVFFDLRGAQASPSLLDATLTYRDDVVREIRLGRHPRNTTRIVIDLQGVSRYNVFSVYNPYRLVIDCVRDLTPRESPVVKRGITEAVLSDVPEPVSAETIAAPAVTLDEPAVVMPGAAQPVSEPSRHAPANAERLPPLPSTSVATMPAGAPAGEGRYSLARQLGLGVSRIVIDPGHGGHDPGAQGLRVSEAELVLDVALRLEKLLARQPGFEVILTRRKNAFVPLEERTAIANRESADLFLSIHANASRNASVRGVETYFLNFASGPEAEAVAARENAGSRHSMRDLPEIVRVITLNNKLDESRDFAATIQQAIVGRLRTRGQDVRNLGVRQAPFVVLVGAGMPAALTEISFVTNREEAQLLRTSKYRQRITEALLEAIVRYRKDLKTVSTLALQE